MTFCFISHVLHVWNIRLPLPWNATTKCIGKYTSPMDTMGQWVRFQKISLRLWWKLAILLNIFWTIPTPNAPCMDSLPTWKVEKWRRIPRENVGKYSRNTWILHCHSLRTWAVTPSTLPGPGASMLSKALQIPSKDSQKSSLKESWRRSEDH